MKKYDVTLVLAIETVVEGVDKNDAISNALANFDHLLTMNDVEPFVGRCEINTSIEMNARNERIWANQSQDNQENI